MNAKHHPRTSQHPDFLLPTLRSARVQTTTIMSSDPPRNVFKETWNLQFVDWSEAEGESEESFSRRLRIVGWIRQKTRSLRGKSNNKDAFPPIKEAPTLSFSDSGDDDEKANEIETKIAGSPLTAFCRWFNNRNRVQKGIYVVGAIIFLIVMVSIIAVLAKEDSSEDASEDSLLNKGFSFPDFSAPSSPTAPFEVFDPVTSPPTTMGSTFVAPTSAPSILMEQANETYVPGNLETIKFGLLLSEGLDAKILAFSDEKVTFDLDEKQSKDRFHKSPGAGATFSDNNKDNEGGWIYVSNSALPDKKGGVGALTFDNNGNILDYEILLKGTSMNSGGGETPWGTWVSCEENGDEGRIFQVDPTGKDKAEETTLGGGGGNWESFAYDVRDQNTPRFFISEDKEGGALQRFVPESPDWNKPWDMLHGDGTTHYLMLVPNATLDGGMFVWTTHEEDGRSNAEKYYPETEGIDVKGSKLYFVCKTIQQLFVLDLDAGTYYNETTLSGLFDGNPDQVENLLSPYQDLVYFTEEGGGENNAGVHARDGKGQYYTVLESQLYEGDTAGLNFSPDGQFMYVAYQSTGLLFAVWRTDGFSFHAAHLDVNYHSSSEP